MRAMPKELCEYALPEALAKIEEIHTTLKSKRRPNKEAGFFMQQILDGVQGLFIDEIRERQSRVPGIEVSELGHQAVWGGDLSPGCQHCVDHGFAPIRSASHCNLSCTFCCYGESEAAVQLLGPDQYVVAERPVSGRELKLMLTKAVRGPGNLQSLAWVYMEPFTAVSKHPDLMAFAKGLGLYQHMYTNGTLCPREDLKVFADAGLDELRFNLAATNCADKVITAMAESRDLFEYLLVESPMYPQYYEAFLRKRKAILATGVSHINCAEMHLTAVNFKHYRDEELYQYSHGYVSPMSSRRLTYDLMDLAAAEEWDVCIHDCSNEVKFLRGVSDEHFGVVHYEAEVPGMPMWWFSQALERYPLTRPN